MDAPLETAKLKIEETVSAIPIETASTEPEEAQPRSQVQKHVYYEEQEREILRVEIFLGHNCPSYLGNRFPKS